MLNLAKYATIAALAGGLGVAVSEPASAWGYGYYGCGDSCGYGYGAFGPYAYGFAYPYYGYYGYRPFYRHHYYGFYDPGRLGLVAILPLERALWRSRRSFPPIEASENRSYRKQRARRRVEAGPPRCQDGRRGEEGRRDNGARGSIAHGVAAQAGKAKDPRRRRAPPRPRRHRSSPPPPPQRMPQRRPRQRRPTPRRRRTKRSSRSSRSRSTSAARRRSFTCGATRINRCRTGARCSMRPLRFRSRSAILTSRSARMCSRRRRETGRACVGPVTIDNGDDAKDALDRITIPQNVLDRIAPTALPRSSIIVSDEPLSSETNYRTEFVAVLNNQPQGGFVTRQPSDNVRGDDGFGSFFQRNWDSQSGNTRRRGGQGWW